MTRTIKKRFPAISQSEGAGALVHRTIGHPNLYDIDPFLLLDEFELTSEAASTGFPDHPHRGFETVTYMLGGYMTHRDTVGNEGTIGPGEIQWMTAGSGLIHSETPDYKAGDVRGLQLWINLPAAEKMRAPRYQDIKADDVPVVDFAGLSVRVLAGQFGGQQGAVKDIAIDPLYLDIQFSENTIVEIPIPAGHTALLYTVKGICGVGARSVDPRTLAILSDGESLQLQGAEGSQIIVIAAAPLNEPIVRYGPFVMNTREEITAALDDFKAGKMAPLPE